MGGVAERARLGALTGRVTAPARGGRQVDVAPHLSIDTDLARDLARTCRRTGDDADRLRVLMARTAIAADVRIDGLALLDRIDETLQLSGDTLELRADLAEAYRLDQPGSILRLDDRLGQAQNDLDRVLATPITEPGAPFPGGTDPWGGGLFPFPTGPGPLIDGPFGPGPSGPGPLDVPPWGEPPAGPLGEPPWAPPHGGGTVCPPVLTPPFGGLGGLGEPGLVGGFGPAVSVSCPVVSLPGVSIDRHDDGDDPPVAEPGPEEPVDGPDEGEPVPVDDDGPDPHGIDVLTGHPPDEIAQGIAVHVPDDRFPEVDTEGLAEQVEEVLLDPLAPRRPTENGIVIRDEERGRTIIINREIPFRSTVIKESDARWKQR